MRKIKPPSVGSTTVLIWCVFSVSRTVAQEVKTVACFARYLSAEDARHEVPADDVFGGYQIRRRIPFIFTVSDVNRLVEAASLFGPSGALRRHTYSTIFALLSVTGMRISEALNLQFEDVTADGLWIRNAKFGKSRFIPLHPTALAGLEKYIVPRRRVVGADSHVFISVHGRKLAHSVVHYEFQKVVRSLEFDKRPGQPHPRIHDMRHRADSPVMPNVSRGVSLYAVWRGVPCRADRRKSA